MIKFLLPVATMCVTTFAYSAVQNVAKFNDVRPANVAVDSKGNVFATMHPLDNPKTKLVKVQDEKFLEFKIDGVEIANAIGIHIDSKDNLYILDLTGKLIVWNLVEKKLNKIYEIPENVKIKTSFLQDFALDEKRNMVYIADMGQLIDEAHPGIIALNLNNGKAKRLFDGSEKVLGGKSPIVVDGKPFMQKNDEKEHLYFGLNPIAFDCEKDYLYFAAMNRGKMYKIKGKYIANFELSQEKLEKKTKVAFEKPSTDGIKAKNGIVYITNIENNTIQAVKGKKVTTLAENLNWADGLFIRDGKIYATVNQLHKSAALNNGKEMAKKPYAIISTEI